MSKSPASSRRRPVRAARRTSAAGAVEPLEGRRLLSAATSFVSGELLVGFRPGVSQADITRFYAQHGFTERQALDRQVRPSDGRLKLVSVPAARTMSLIPELQRDPRVAYAEPNYLIPTAATTPNDPTVVRDWGLSNALQTLSHLPHNSSPY